MTSIKEALALLTGLALLLIAVGCAERDSGEGLVGPDVPQALFDVDNDDDDDDDDDDATSFTEPFNTDTQTLPGPYAPTFTLNGGSGSVSSGELVLRGNGTRLFVQRFTRPGFSGDLTITGKVKAATFGFWTAGMEFGNRRFIFHPGFPNGAFRIEDASLAFPSGIIIGNTNMGFTPSATVFHTMQLDWNSTLNQLKITITDGAPIPDPASPFVFTWTPDPGFNPTGALGFTLQHGAVRFGPNFPAFFDDLTVSGNQPDDDDDDDDDDDGNG